MERMGAECHGAKLAEPPDLDLIFKKVEGSIQHMDQLVATLERLASKLYGEPGPSAVMNEGLRPVRNGAIGSLHDMLDRQAAMLRNMQAACDRLGGLA